MSSPKSSPLDLLKGLQELNPSASAAEIKELMWDLLQRSPEKLGKQTFDELFDHFVKETKYRGERQNALGQFEAWLKKPHN